MLYEYLKGFMLQHPDQVLCDEHQCMTYAQLLDYAEQVGSTLQAHKYGILCKSDLNTAKALFACLYARKTAVLLSYRYGEKHTQRIVDAMQLSHVLTDDKIEVLSEEQEEIEDLTDVALILCTSGTTGTPKGAMITHRNLITNLRDIAQYFAIHETDTILIARPLYHCAVLTGEFFISLIKGLAIEFLSGEFSPAKILHNIDEKKISVLCGTPTMFYHLSNLLLKNMYTPAIKTIAVSGECMTQMVAARMRKVFPSVDIYNVYGLTEASPRVCYLSPEQFDAHPDSVGVPLSSLQAKVVDNELCICGASIMKGYYNQPQATQKVLVDGWLHTGDIAEIDTDGRIYIRCRKDNMIIRAGMNIYPQEIENALKQQEAIKDVLAFGVKSETVGEKICIQVVTDALTKSEVFAICKAHLPIFQLPDHIEIVHEIPRNASGKVIRYGKESDRERI